MQRKKAELVTAADSGLIPREGSSHNQQYIQLGNSKQTAMSLMFALSSTGCGVKTFST